MKDSVVFGIIEVPGEEERLILIADNDKPAPRFYKFPGGRARSWESPEIALFREIVEEVGINIDKNPTEIIRIDKRNHEVIFFYGKYYSGEIRAGQEVAEILLSTPAEIQAMVEKGQVLRSHAEAFGKYMKLKSEQASC